MVIDLARRDVAEVFFIYFLWMFNSRCFTGAMTLCLTNPIWVTKTRLILQYNSDPSQKLYRGMLDALVKIYRQEGVAGLYRVGRGVGLHST